MMRFVADVRPVKGRERLILYATSMVAFLLAILATGEARAAIAMRGVHSSAEAAYTRIVIDLSTPTSYEYALIPPNPRTNTPARLYVDLRGVVLERKRDYGIWVGDMRVRRVRVGQYQPTTARVVLELDGPVTPKVFQIEKPPRIVVDLTGRGSGRPPGTAVAAAEPVGKPVTAKPQAAPSTSAQVASARTPPASAAREAPPGERMPNTAHPGPINPRPPVSAGRGTAIRVMPPKPAVPAASPSAAPKARRIRIVLDPGHGGKDPGAKGPGGVEKDAVLDISRRLAEKLRTRLGVDVHLTRSDDTYIALDARKNVANRLEADLFVSIHANASKNSKSHGIETYYLKNTNDRATLRLARLENGVDMLIGSDVSTDADLSYILSDIIQGQKEADSILLANHIQGELCAYLSTSYDSIQSLGVKQGPFFVLDGTYMPAVLVETGFISNSHEGRRLRATSYRDSLAEGIYRGIKRYLEDDRVNDLS